MIAAIHHPRPATAAYLNSGESRERCPVPIGVPASDKYLFSVDGALRRIRSKFQDLEDAMIVQARREKRPKRANQRAR